MVAADGTSTGSVLMSKEQDSDYYNKYTLTPECICEPPVMNMSCPAHAWYFEMMRGYQPVCDNRLADMLTPETAGTFPAENRAARRRAKKWRK